MWKSRHLLLKLLTATVLDVQLVRANLEDRAVNCNVVTGALAILKPLGAPATSFCSSYLRIPATATTATTTTPATVTSFTSTVTVTTTQAACPAARVKRGPLPPKDLNSRRRAAAQLVAERAVKINIPALSIFAASQLSSACSCLNIKPKFTTTNTLAAAAPTFNTDTTTTTCTTSAPPPPPTCLGNPCDFGGERCCAGLACSAPRVDLPDRCCRFSGASCVNSDECCTGNCRSEPPFGLVCQ